MPRVNKDILKWARDTAGLTLDEAVKKLGIKPNRTHTAVQKLESLEAGQAEPSRSMLVRMAKHYRRPLIVFYLSKVPRKGTRGQDFRTLPASYTAADNALVDALIRGVRARQDIVLAALQAEDEAKRLDFVNSRRIDDGPQVILETLRDVLEVSVKQFRDTPDPASAFALLRSRAEKAGAYVLLIGDLGSYHSAISVETFRGFALADPFVPFVIINDKDAPEAWSFTLLHELCHLILGATGVSGARSDSTLEQLCSDIASEFLLPANELAMLALPASDEIEQLSDAIGSIAGPRNLSRTMVAYRLYRAGKLSQAAWRGLRDKFRDEWMRNRALARLRVKEQESGPNYYIVRRHRLGHALIESVSRLLSDGALSPTKAGIVLGVKPQNVAPLIVQPPQGTAA